LLVNTEKKLPQAEPSTIVRAAGIAVRSIFLVILTIITVRVSSPQNEHLLSISETPGDLIRVALGFLVCIWLVANLFILPKDPEGFQTWLRLGIVVLPLSVICAIVVW
jgi:hypothetical protein